VFELAKVMGTSVAMIERHYGTLIGGAHERIAGRLNAIEAALQQVIETEPRRSPDRVGSIWGMSRSTGTAAKAEGMAALQGLRRMRPARFERATSASAGQRSIP
jgi:hypothetical protein